MNIISCQPNHFLPTSRSLADGDVTPVILALYLRFGIAQVQQTKKGNKGLYDCLLGTLKRRRVPVRGSKRYGSVFRLTATVYANCRIAEGIRTFVCEP